MAKARQDKQDAFIIVDRLILDGKTYTVDNIHTVPAALNPNSIATPQIGDNIKAFFGGQSPLSNFHPGKFKVGMEWYDNSEQFYQKKKSDFVEDDEAGIRIMHASTPLECYRIGKELNAKLDIQLWNSGPALRIMEEGLKAKFEQNMHLKKFLMDTGKMTLVEASPRDCFWGVGIRLRDHTKLLDIPNWPGKNKLGKMLERIRDAFAANPTSN